MIGTYMTSDTGTIHIVRGPEPVSYGLSRTACGRRVLPSWVMGDETVNGIAATCRACRNNCGVGQG